MSVRGLARFLSPSALEAFPLPGATFETVHPAWVYHKYLGMTTTVTPDEDHDAANPTHSIEPSSEPLLCDSLEAAAARCAKIVSSSRNSASSTMVYDHVYAYGPSDTTTATAEMG